MMIVAYTVLLVAVASANAPPSTALNLQTATALPSSQLTAEDSTPDATQNEPGELTPRSVEIVTVSSKSDDAGSERTNVSKETSTGDGNASEDAENQAPNSRCPAKCDCAELADRTIYNCSLPSGVVKFEEFGDGIIFTCYVSVFFILY